jgi:putative flippase GtrA
VTGLLFNIARVLVATLIGVLVGLGLSLSVCFVLAVGMGNDAGVALVMAWAFLIGPMAAFVCGLAGLVLSVRRIKEG